MLDPKIEYRIHQIVDMRVREHERSFMLQGAIVGAVLLAIGEVFRRVCNIDMVAMFLQNLG